CIDQAVVYGDALAPQSAGCAARRIGDVLTSRPAQFCVRLECRRRERCPVRYVSGVLRFCFNGGQRRVCFGSCGSCRLQFGVRCTASSLGGFDAFVGRGGHYLAFGATCERRTVEPSISPRFTRSCWGNAASSWFC